SARSAGLRSSPAAKAAGGCTSSTGSRPITDAALTSCRAAKASRGCTPALWETTYEGALSMRRAAFDLFHPAVAFVYFAVMLALAMTAAQPVCALIAYGGAISYDAVLRGPRAAVRAAAWHVPVVLVIAVANLLFSATGATELFRLG